jgi:GWxTD domain-containing protein
LGLIWPVPLTMEMRSWTVEKPDPLKRPLSDKEKIAQQKALKDELKGVYKKWVDEDVRWIITDQELQAFKSLSNDEERDQFIEKFWLRRNPNPDSPENEYREEHYARIAYANEHFAAGKPGWRTDRGHIYIAYGKPDSIDSHPSGGSYERPMEEGGGNLDLPVRDLALPLSGGHRRQHRHRVCRHLHVRRLPHDDRPLGEGRAEARSGAGLTMYEQTGAVEEGGPVLGRRAEQLGAGPMSRRTRASSSTGWTVSRS